MPFKSLNQALVSVACYASLLSLPLMGCQNGSLDFGEPPLSFELDACLGVIEGDAARRACLTGTSAEGVTRACFEIKGVTVEVSLDSTGALIMSPDARALAEAQVRYWGERPIEVGLMTLSPEAPEGCVSYEDTEDTEGCSSALGCVARGTFVIQRAGDRVTLAVGGEERCEWRYSDASGVERCDGLDNDCDERVDEGFAVGELCQGEGLGVCSQPGGLVCDEGGGVRCAHEGPPLLPSEERCDGLDHDCDGRVDESFPEEGTTCEPVLGEGLSPVSATYQCQAGALICPVDERCDGEDNDLDGRVDEGFGVGERCTPINNGCFSSTGQLQCVTTELLSSRIGELGEVGCVPDRVTIEVENELNCDGVDNDCDGFVDEGYLEVQLSCGVGECTNDAGRRRCVNGEVVDDCRALAPSESDDSCDGRDDDCDGLLDEDFIPYSSPCEGLLGECQREAPVYCVQNELRQTCPVNVSPPAAEDVHCDGLDEDCDGSVDESYQAREVTCGLGVCQVTVLSSCQGGTEESRCTPTEAIEGARDDNCDGQDDDCDGRVDEGYTPRPYLCFQGACAQSFVTSCLVTSSGSVEQRECPSTSLIQPQPERCDGLDNDCDGDVDEWSSQLTVTSCGVGVCQRTGEEVCVGGVTLDSCVPAEPDEGVIDDCDGLDNDCDGKVDEAFVGSAVSCIGGCAELGVTLCLNGTLSDSCTDVVDPNNPEEVCDGVDQDCDGELDEGYVAAVTSCGLGLCASTGVTFCQLGLEGDSCQPGNPSPDVSCDGFDQDCDGRVDEVYPVTPVLCGQGECLNSGLRTCANGEPLVSCTPLSPRPDDNCNHKDDDCDGFIDEAYPVTPITCGVGVCQQVGLRVCTSSGAQNNCTPLLPQVSDNDCNGLDEDCDGLVDEGFIGALFTCGLGPCSNTVRSTCVSGVEQELCEPLNVASPDTTCNQQDEDCDGLFDESFVGTLEQCGPGSCEPTALQICTNTGVVSTCSYQDSSTDQSCNGVDEDCDGLLDEDYLGPVTTETCGVGVCEAEATVQCVQGSAQVVCRENSSQGEDDTCDGVDQDCDGDLDEGFSQTLTCGVGACERTVQVDCDGSCIPGGPVQERCGDLIDNDCDGLVDEGFEALDEVCTVGVGACRRTGLLRCKPQDLTAPLECSVAPGEPSIEVCDGLDNDCDGSSDESTGDPVVCVVDRFAGTSCEIGHLECLNGTSVCVSDISPNELEENYCTAIDEDCDYATVAQVNSDTISEDVIYLDEDYNVQLGAYCGTAAGLNCKWTCLGGVTLSCYRAKSNVTCIPDPTL